MGRKKRHNRQPNIRQSPREEPFHAPFQGLKNAAPSHDDHDALPPPSPEAPQPEARTRQQAHTHQEATSFLHAMADVTPLPRDPRGRVGKRQRKGPMAGLPTDEEAVLASLRALVAGRNAFAIQHTDEYMEGVAPGIDRRLAQRLHRGDYAVQAQLDLHGYTVDEAKQLVDRFLTQTYTTAQRCVRLIHGRGNNSRDNRPVLKEHVQVWLSQGRLSRLVLAFATAPAHDGGAGATYVLLRRVTKSRQP